MKQTFADDLLNSLTAHIAVLDEHGAIVAVNEQWKRFARENGGDSKVFYVGSNYISVCEAAIARGENGIAQSVLDGIRKLLHGEKNEFSIEYPCHGPVEQLWFIAHITRFFHAGSAYLVIAHENITTRKKAEDRLYKTEATLRKVLEALPVGVWIMNKEGQIIHGNPAGLKIWAGARYVGPEQFSEYKGWWLDSGRRIAADEWAAARAIQKGETSIDEEILIECFDGSKKIILNSAIPLHDSSGNIDGAIIVNQDITSRKRSEEQLLKANSAIDAMNRELQQVLAREKQKARTDELTGLSNRRHLFELGEKLFIVAKRYNTQLSVALFDIDNFKQINDSFGHQVGDMILKRVAETAREHIRNSDIFARYGGEEFIILLPNTGTGGALALMEDIRKKISATRQNIDDREVIVTISVGVAERLPDDNTLYHLIRHADQALYTAKNAGRNCSRIFSAVSL